MTIILNNVNKTDLADAIKTKMIHAGYPEKDLTDFEAMLDKGDVAQWLLGDLISSEDVEFED